MASQSLDAGVEAAFMTSGLIFLDDAAICHFVNDGTAES